MFFPRTVSFSEMMDCIWSLLFLTNRSGAWWPILHAFIYATAWFNDERLCALPYGGCFILCTSQKSSPYSMQTVHLLVLPHSMKFLFSNLKNISKAIPMEAWPSTRFWSLYITLKLHLLSWQTGMVVDDEICTSAVELEQCINRGPGSKFAVSSLQRL